MSELIKFVIFWIGLPFLLILCVTILAHFHKGFGEHVKGMFMDSAGKPSFTRMASFIALMSVIAWVTHIVWKTLVIPELWDSVMFIGAMFFLDRLPEIIAAWKGGISKELTLGNATSRVTGLPPSAANTSPPTS